MFVFLVGCFTLLSLMCVACFIGCCRLRFVVRFLVAFLVVLIFDCDMFSGWLLC